MKRIAIITHSEYPIEPRCRRQAEALAERGDWVDVFCLRRPGQPAREIIDGVHVHRLPVRRHQGRGLIVYLLEYAKSFLLFSLALVRSHLQHRYDLIQVHNPPDLLVFCTLPFKCLGTPVILDQRELEPELFVTRFGHDFNSLSVRFLIALQQLSTRYADAVLTVLHPQKDDLVARGTPADKVHVILNCADSRFFAPLDPAPPSGHFRLVYHGSILYRYGLDLLIKAMPRVRAAIPEVQLDIYGTGDYLNSIRQLVHQLGLEGVVTLWGAVPLSEIPTCLAQADLGIVPHRRLPSNEKGLPTKLMEYAALGKPAVVARSQSVETYFEDDMVRYFEPDNEDELVAAIVELYRNPERRAALARNIRRFNEQYNWGVMKQVYYELIDRLCQKSG